MVLLAQALLCAVRASETVNMPYLLTSRGSGAESSTSAKEAQQTAE